MTTPRTRSLVSLVTTLAATLALGACASAPSRHAGDGLAPMEGSPLAVRFDNDARTHVHVYLVGERREWLLGRVEPGAIAALRIPNAALAENQGFVRLAVLAGERVTLRAAANARTEITIAQPASAILAQRWTFSRTLSQGQLTARRL